MSEEGDDQRMEPGDVTHWGPVTGPEPERPAGVTAGGGAVPGSGLDAGDLPTGQPGYDALAELYDRRFPGPWERPLDRHSLDAFADALPRGGTILDLGCGTGHVTVELAFRGFRTIGVDPSERMLEIARKRYPSRTWIPGDAHFPAESSQVRAAGPIAGIVARFSLIHVPPEQIPAVLASWSANTEPGCRVLVVFQCLLEPDLDAQEFDHVVAPAWRWNPSALARALDAVGFAETWRVIVCPDEGHPYPECHLSAVRR
ncbi:class I SAM-dependent DNA methyltransferase [Citricoccus sp. CH26A]|uniref:class I SAM-dependent DNA methyltransferase n=1 Tax=Citricoccus TaxID=169133 RepID=UPI001145D4D3|nr:class I SAM-dependent methyltransferase [Citricoccus sp. CH26A]